MREILRLKDELMDGNFTEAIKLVSQLSAMFRQERLDLIENFLALAISRLIVIQLDRERINMTYLYELRNALIEIQKKNRLGETDFYIEVDKWQSVYEGAVPWGLLIAVETVEILDGTDPEELERIIDFDELKSEALRLIRLTYSFDLYELDKYLRSLWLERQMYRN
ncbi:MAG: hypothetical protein AAF298_24870 [Cyanobacteria bacterium P01_A01_bin.40]